MNSKSHSTITSSHLDSLRTKFDTTKRQMIEFVGQFKVRLVERFTNTMTEPWNTKPFIYEINTRVWLTELSKRYGAPITLRNIPDEAVDELAKYNVDAIWMMGIWTRSAAVRASAMNYTHEYTPVLPDLKEDDVIGSAYAIGAYEVEPVIGGRAGLARFREQLNKRGLKLILDYVPNHVAVDHPEVARNPKYFVRGNAREFKHNQGMFFKTKDTWGRDLYVAHGRDPYFPGWIDTAQLNAFSPHLRRATVATLLDIATQCDGVRCDMAMLMTNEVFSRTWGWLLEEERPEVEFWDFVIPRIQERYPNFLFIAEVYWNMDYQLQQQGFDYTYDKDLYDRLFEANLEQIRTHLSADVNFQKHTIRFIENHDEGRAAAEFGISKSKALATLIATLPGAVLLHDGQFTGRNIKLPVQIARQPDEHMHDDLKNFYLSLLKETRNDIYQHGEWQMLSVYDGDILAYGWTYKDDHRVIVINLSDQEQSAAIDLNGWGDDWQAEDVLSNAGERQSDHGYMKTTLAPHESHIYKVEMITPEPLPPIKKAKRIVTGQLGD